MYARLSTYPLRPGTRAEVEEDIDHWAQQLAGQPGHRRTTFYFTEAGDQFGAISLWDTRAHAEAVTAALGAATMRTMSSVMAGPPATQIVEVVHDAGSEPAGRTGRSSATEK